MTQPLDATEGKIKTHWKLLGDDLAALAKSGFALTDVNGAFAADRAFADFKSSLAEDAERQRGGRVPAIPLGSELVSGLRFWVSYLEEWKLFEKNTYRFRSANLTFFQNGPGDQHKVQLFRAEWPGYTNWGGGAPSWQAAGAGHPHWQFDSLSSYVSNDVRQAEVNRMVETLSKAGGIEEFGAEDASVIRELVYGREIDLSWTRMHFASQARWSTSPWRGELHDVTSHAHAPSCSKQVRDWLISVIVYAREELGR